MNKEIDIEHCKKCGAELTDDYCSKKLYQKLT